MQYIPLEYRPGTRKTPQLTELQTISFSDTSGVHFPDNILRTIPQWSDVTPTQALTFLGGCRRVFAGYTDKYYYFFGTHKRLYVLINGTLYNITPLQESSTAIANSLDAVNTSTTVTVNATAHGLEAGDRVKIEGATTFAGIPAIELNKEHIIASIPSANEYTITVTTAATSTVNAGGGASTVYYPPIADGNLDQSTGSGYGGGRYGVGLYGVAKTFTNTLVYPRIWSIDIFGNDFVMCPGDYAAGDGQKLYIWDGDTTAAPTVLTNAPTDANWTYVSQNAVVALSNNTVQVSSVGDATVWTPAANNSAYSDDIERANRLIAGIRARNTDLLFTEDEVLSFTFIDSPDYWRVDDLQQSDGLIAPNAVVAVEETIYWMGKFGWYVFDGSAVNKIENPLNEDFVLQNLNQGQRWKIFAKPDPENSQIWWFYPCNASNEPDCYVIYNYKYGHWTLGNRNLTATQIPSSLGSKYYSAESSSDTVAGSIYLDNQVAGTEELSPYAESSDAYLFENAYRGRVRRIICDGEQTGNYTVTLKTKRFPQSATETSSSTYTVEPNTTYINTKAAGKTLAARFEQSGAGNRFTLGSILMEVHRQGQR